jgi:hypothetical protein
MNLSAGSLHECKSLFDAYNWGKSFTSPLLFPSPCAIRGSLLYSLVLGGTQAQLGTTQTQEGPYAKSPTSRAHLVQ